MESKNGIAETVCIDLEKTDLSVPVRRRIRKLIGEDTLEYVNEHSTPVTPRKSFYSVYGKRFMDIVVSGCALVVTLPINLIIAVCTFFDVGRPIMFFQDRVGQDETTFQIVKFRNMTNKTDANGDLLPASKRVTKFGKFVRKTSLDELLNFWSVFKGDMSLIGPRPLVWDYQEYLSDRHRMRTAVRPGLECPMIIPVEHKVSWTEQFENDIYYVENVSFLLDIKMMFALVRMVFDRKSSAMRGGATRGSFMGYHKDGSSIAARKVPEHYVEEAIKWEKENLV